MRRCQHHARLYIQVARGDIKEVGYGLIKISDVVRAVRDNNSAIRRTQCRPWYQDWRTSEKVERSKRLSTLMVGKRGEKRKIHRIYCNCRGSPRDLRDSIICSKVRISAWTALFTHAFEWGLCASKANRRWRTKGRGWQSCQWIMA